MSDGELIEAPIVTIGKKTSPFESAGYFSRTSFGDSGELSAPTGRDGSCRSGNKKIIPRSRKSTEL
jgi:hypothetical protein